MMYGSMVFSIVLANVERSEMVLCEVLFRNGLVIS